MFTRTIVTSRRARSIAAAISLSGLAAALVVATAPHTAHADSNNALFSSTDIVGPLGSEAFGENVVVLSNGNYVVADPLFDIIGKADVGAVFLYDGVTNQLISTLHGSENSDHVGADGITEVGGGNFVVQSSNWTGNAVAKAGAVTWVNGRTGLEGAVSAQNSLIGASPNDFVGQSLDVLSNGNFVTSTDSWANGGALAAGAATWGSGTTGIATGPVSAANSLVGGLGGDGTSIAVTALSNGNFAVEMPHWDEPTAGGPVRDVGAVTWGNGTSGTAGVVGAARSVLGGSIDDGESMEAVALANGNFVVKAPSWDNNGKFDVGAALLLPGDQPLPTRITAANSLIGSTAGDRVGDNITPLVSANGDFVVTSGAWHAGAASVGAVTWRPGNASIVGAVGAANSLIGTTKGDMVVVTVTPLSNGNYVVGTPFWDNGAGVDTGASTWRPGGHSSAGVIGSQISLVGATPGDDVGIVQTPLTNGNYVVGAPFWDNGNVVDVGAVTFGDGVSGTVDTVLPKNSLIGSTKGDDIGFTVLALANGNAVTISRGWDGPSGKDVGAVTWLPGNTPSRGVVGVTTSFVGAAPAETLGLVTVLPNGDYVIQSAAWSRPGAVNAGAASLASGTAPTAGTSSDATSLTGSHTNDAVGTSVVPVRDGSFVVINRGWGTGAAARVGALTWEPVGGLTGQVSDANSLLGTLAGAGTGWTVALDADNSVRLTATGSLLLGRGTENRVTLITRAAVAPPPPVDPPAGDTPPPSGPGAELASFAPARLLDTREGFATIDGQFAGAGRRDAGSIMELQVGGRGGVPGDASAAVLNVTAVNPTLGGFVTVYPCGSDRPNASSVNASTGAVAANSTITRLGTGGTVCLFTSQAIF